MRSHRRDWGEGGRRCVKGGGINGITYYGVVKVVVVMMAVKEGEGRGVLVTKHTGREKKRECVPNA